VRLKRLISQLISAACGWDADESNSSVFPFLSCHSYRSQQIPPVDKVYCEDATFNTSSILRTRYVTKKKSFKPGVATSNGTLKNTEAIPLVVSRPLTPKYLIPIKKVGVILYCPGGMLCLCFHWVVQDTKHLFLVHTGGVHTTCSKQ